MMKKDEFERLAVAMIYNEISAQDRRRLEEWLERHPEDRADYEGLKKAHAVLNRLQDIQTEETPISAPYLVSMVRSQKRWQRWAVAAAACLAILFVCMSQGVVLQVGSTRIALGPERNTGEVLNEVQREMTEQYLPLLDELVETVQQMQTVGEITSQRQDALENTLKILAAFREMDLKLNENRMKDFSTELARAIDDRFNQFYALAYNPRYSDSANVPDIKRDESDNNQ